MNIHTPPGNSECARDTQYYGLSNNYANLNRLECLFPIFVSRAVSGVRLIEQHQITIQRNPAHTETEKQEELNHPTILVDTKSRRERHVHHVGYERSTLKGLLDGGYWLSIQAYILYIYILYIYT